MAEDRFVRAFFARGGGQNASPREGTLLVLQHHTSQASFFLAYMVFMFMVVMVKPRR